MKLLPQHSIQPGQDGQVLGTVNGRTSWVDAEAQPYREPLVASAVTPPDQLTSSDETDYLYGEAQ